jgi:hypothetical protein
MDALIDRQTGDVLIVTEPGVIAWSPRERDSETLCVITLDDATLAMSCRACGKLFYPYGSTFTDAAGQVRRKRISELQVPASKRNYRAAVVREGLSLVLDPPLDLQMMATAVGAEVSDVGAGKTYTTLAAWWAATKSNSALAPQARVWGPDDVGIVLIDGAAATPTPTYPHRIFAAEGERHDGSRSSSGDAHINVPAGQTGIETRSGCVHIEGMRVSLDATFVTTQGIYLMDPTGLGLVEGNCVVLSGHSQQASGMVIEANAQANVIGTIRNNIAYGLDGAAPGSGIVVQAAAINNARSVDATIENNTVLQMSSVPHMQGIECRGISINAAATITVISRNNVVASSIANGFGEYHYGENSSLTMTQHACVSTDATASLWGGEGNLTDQVATELFDDLDDATTPKQLGPLDRTGVNVYGDGVTTDGQGNPRPDVGPFTIGAASLYSAGDPIRNLYRGDSARDMDYSAPVGRCRSAGPSATFANVELPLSQTSYLGVRTMSQVGVEETNTDRVTAITLDAQGNVTANPVACVNELNVRELAGGGFVLGFVWTDVAGGSADRFEVFSDAGTGTLQTQTPVATLTSRGSGEYATRLAPSLRPGMYGVQAARGSSRSTMAVVAVEPRMTPPTAPQLLQEES